MASKKEPEVFNLLNSYQDDDEDNDMDDVEKNELQNDTNNNGDGVEEREIGAERRAEEVRDANEVEDLSINGEVSVGVSVSSTTTRVTEVATLPKWSSMRPPMPQQAVADSDASRQRREEPSIVDHAHDDVAMSPEHEAVTNTNGEIIHVPSKPPFSPTQQPRVDVFASVIDPKLANTLVRKLNHIAPLENLRHVKRVRKSCFDGKIQLSVILCPSVGNGSELGSMPMDLQELTNCYQLSPFVTQVCKYAATSKEEWEEQCKLWPTSFHPPTYNIDGITGFNKEDSKVVFHHMNFAIKLSKSVGSQWVNVAVIVDPSTNQVITSACDEISSWNMCLDGNEVHSLNSDEATPSQEVANGTITSNFNLNGSFNNPHTSCTTISCLNPFQWSLPHLSSSKSCFWHPLQHAAIVAIENSAARDRRLYPSMGVADERSIELDPKATSAVAFPAKRQKTTLANVNNGDDAPSSGFLSKSERPYLCTGYDIYLAWEPCAMCAMALVHQRVRRIFYAFSNPNNGALGSVYRLQGERSLNHHYAVFQVKLHDEESTFKKND